jgi:DNA-binding IclR family transcriptional regulator
VKKWRPQSGSPFHDVEYDGYGETGTTFTNFRNSEMTRDQNGSQIQVIDRAVGLMRVLAEADEPQGLREIARRATLSPSTTRRILASLCHHQLCEQTPEGAYRLGLALFELGTRVEADLDIRTRSLPVLKRLSEESHLTAFVCVQRDDRVIAIERVDGRYAFSLALTVGGSLPLNVGAAPRALLAHMPEDEVVELLAAEPPQPLTEATLLGTEDILADMRLTRERGYVISDEDVTPGVAALGMPVFGHVFSDRPVAAISVAGLVPQVLGEDFEQLLGQLREAADEISRELGHGLSADRPEPAGSAPEAA